MSEWFAVLPQGKEKKKKVNWINDFQTSLQYPMWVLELIGFIKGKKRPTGDLYEKKDVEQKESGAQKEDWADPHVPTMMTEDVL